MKGDEAFLYEFENSERIAYLVAAFINQELTPMERRELDAWITQSDEHEALFNQMIRKDHIDQTMAWFASVNEKKAYSRMKKRLGRTGAMRSLPVWAMGIAASVIIVIAVGVIWLMRPDGVGAAPQSSPVAVNSAEPLPGSDKAVLTLAGGKKVVLDSATPSTLEQGRIRIDNGTLSYAVSPSSVPTENILTVPRGGQYRIVLPDGTKVWLNAASSLRYPTAFDGHERRVALTGEAYFEVSKNKEKPFIVEASGNSVRVLGTQFNVNSYGDERAFSTTLVEGSVEISGGGATRVLKPGQQARISGGKMEVVAADVFEATGWKDGEFVFRDAPVADIARQLARWYDMEVEYRDIVNIHLNATIKRKEPLSKVLYFLQQTGDVHFTIEGRKLIVSKGSQ